MADENGEPKTVFEQAKEAALKHVHYSTYAQAMRQNKFIPNLVDIAYNAANEVEEKILEEDAKNNLETANTNQLFDYIAGAADKFGVRTQKIFAKNLEEIINTSPQKTLEGIEKILFEFAPKEKVDDEYKEITRLHREIVHMDQVMKAYANEQSEDKKKDWRDDYMVKEIAIYYQGLYKDGKSPELAKENEALLKASVKWASRNQKLCEAKYHAIYKRKIEDFRAKLIGYTWKEYKALKKLDDDEELEWNKQTEADLENEEDDYVRQQHREKRRLQMKRTHLGEKISRKIPEYLKNAMAPEAIMGMYESYWDKEAKEEARRQAA